jgi:hypothetical protein
MVTVDGNVQLAWTVGTHHVEIDVLPDGSIEWFHMDRDTKAYEGSEDPAAELPAALKDALKTLAA